MCIRDSRRAVEKFRERGVEPVFFPVSTTILNRRQVRIGYQGKSVNPQFEFDHCKDKAIYYDRAMANRHLAALKKAYEECRKWISAKMCIRDRGNTENYGTGKSGPLCPCY